MFKKTISLLLALAMTVSVSSVSFAEEDTRGDFVFGYSVGSTDPASGAYAWTCMRYGVGEALFKIDDNMNVVNNLVCDYSLAEDQLTWTFELRDDVLFHNGKSMDAAAVKACLERTTELQPRADGELKIASMEADGYTLTVTTREPNPTLINSLCDPFACIIDVEAGTDFDTAAVGTGPFMVTEFHEDDRVELDAFDDYWGGKPASKHVTIKDIGDLDAMSLALQNGEIDAAYGLPYDALDIFGNNDQFKVSQTATSRVYMLYFNLEHEFVNDPVFRKAICMAVDKESYGAILINGAGTPTKATFPNSASFGDDALMTDVPDYDPEGAKALLAENGYVDSDGDGILDKDGKKVSLQLITYGRTGLPQSSQALQSALTQLGMEVTFEQLDSVEERCNAGEYDICAYAQVTLPTADPYSYLVNNYGTGGTNNFGKYSNAEVDELLAQMASEFDVDKRSELAVKIQQIVTSDSSVCNMFHLNMFMAMKANVKGINQSPVDYYHINVDTCIEE